MYAIIKTGGKQLRVEEGDVIDIERLVDAEEGSQVQFKEVLFVGDGSTKKVGQPTVSGFAVHGQVLGMSAGPKISSVKYKPSHNEWKKFGHRQKYLRVKVTKIGKAAKE